MKWISVDDELPKEPGRYLTYYPDMYGCEVSDYDIFGFSMDGDGYMASHWMPLPEPPTKREIE